MGNNAEGIIELALDKNVLGDIFVEATEMLTKEHMYQCIEKTKHRYLNEPIRFSDLIPILESLKNILNNENAYTIYSYFYNYLYQQVESLNLFSSPEINDHEKFLKNAELIISEVIAQENYRKNKEVLNGIYNILKDESVYRVMKSFYLTRSFETEMLKAIISNLTIINEDEFIKTEYRLVEESKEGVATSNFTNEELEKFLRFFTYESNFPSLVSHLNSIEKNGYITYQAYVSHFKKLFFMYVKGIINISDYFKPVILARSNSKEFVSDHVSFFESLSTALHPSHIRILYSNLSGFTMELMKSCIIQYLIYEPFIVMENIEKSNQFSHMQRKKVYVQLEAQRDDLIKKLDRLFLLNNIGIYKNLYDKFYDKSTEKFNCVLQQKSAENCNEKYRVLPPNIFPTFSTMHWLNGSSGPCMK